MDSINITSDTLTIAFRLGLATVLGGAIGLNREMSLKPAGLRTHALVALGAALATHIGLQLAQPGVGDTAARHRPAPAATPVAATTQMDAAVVRPCTLAPSRRCRIAPPPMKPMPATIP